MAIVVLVIFVAVVLPSAGGLILTKNARAGRAERTVSSDVIAAFVADQELQSHWLAEETSAGTDASTFLATRVSFRGDGIEQMGTTRMGIPKATDDALQKMGKDVWDRIDDVPLDGVDLAWVGELSAFGHWDIEAPGSPMNIRPWSWTEAPIPDFMSLMTLHTLRLVVGIRSGDVVPAFTEARALARLSTSTELLIGQMSAAGMAHRERRAFEAARARGLDVSGLAAAGIEIADEVTIERFKRACFGAPMPFVLDPPHLGLEDSVKVCRCSGLQEGISGADFLRPFVFGTYKERFARLDRELSSSTCRLRNARESWSAAQTQTVRQNLAHFCATVGKDNAGEFCKVSGALVFLPFLREGIGETLLSIAAPDWWRKYGEPLPTSTASTPPTQ